MFKEDFDSLSDLLDGVWSLKNQAISAPAKSIWFMALKEFSLDEVRMGLTAHVRDPDRSRFLPMPGDVILQINGVGANDGRPGAEEAWAIASRASDEAQTIVWNDEIAEALDICRPVLSAGDEVGARMAFKEAYARLTDDARARRVPVQWRVSEGHDVEARERVITEAVKAGMIDRAQYPALPAPRSAALLLLAGPDVPMPDSARAALLALRSRLVDRAESSESEDRKEKIRTGVLRQISAQAVTEHGEEV